MRCRWEDLAARASWGDSQQTVLHKVSTVDVVILLFATLGALVVVFHLTAAVLALGIVRQIVDRLDWRRSGMIDRGSGGKWLVHDGFTVCEA